MTTEMSLETLETQHAELEQQIEQELNRPMPDQALIADLKKQKLRIKDEIEGHASH
jgi:hypothetical protein